MINRGTILAGMLFYAKPILREEEFLSIMLDPEDTAPADAVPVDAVPVDAIPEDAVPAAGHRKRLLVAALVVLAAAATGYLVSRVWPMSTSVAPATHLAAARDTSSAEPRARERAPSLASPASRLAPAADPAAPADVASPSQPAQVASLPDKAPIEVRSASTSSPDSSAAVLNRAPAGQADADERSAPPSQTGDNKNERAAATPRKAASAKAPVRGPKTSGAKSSVAGFAANPGANQALREFMAYPSRN
jgi:hypothetical protein